MYQVTVGQRDIMLESLSFIEFCWSQIPLKRNKVDKEEFLDEKGKVNFKMLQYNLEDLFKDPPLFDQPPIVYANENEDLTNSQSKMISVTSLGVNNSVEDTTQRSNEQWGKISQMVLTGNDEKMKYIKNYEHIKQKLNHLSRAPFWYTYKNVATSFIQESPHHHEETINM